MNKTDGIYSKFLLHSVVWVGLIAFVVCLTLVYLMLHSFIDLDMSLAGSMGDFIGGILNPIIALLGVTLLALTLRQNSTALKLTHQELEKSTEQMRLSAEALQKQEYLMRTEREENLLLKITEKIQSDYARPFANPNSSSSKSLINSKEEATKNVFSSLDSIQHVYNILRLVDNQFGQDHLYFHTIRKLVKGDDEFKIDEEKLLLPSSIINTNYLLISSLIIHHRMVHANSNFVHFDDDRVYDMLLKMIKIAGADQLWREVFQKFKNY